MRVLNPHGLHARPAKQLVQIARAQPMPINVRLEEGSATTVSAASLTKVIGLGARRGQWLISPPRANSNAALDAIAAASRVAWVRKSRPSMAVATRPQPPAPVSPPSNHSLPIRPIPACRFAGWRLPRCSSFVRCSSTILSTPISPTTIVRLEAALKEGAAQLQALVHKAPGGEVADILSMHEEMLDDPELHQAAIDAIRESRSAEAGWWEAIDTAAHAQEMLADRLLAERAADLRDVGRRVLGVLCDVSLPEPPEHPYILVMDDIGPSDVARLDTSRVRGLLTVRGGATAHSDFGPCAGHSCRRRRR